MVATKSGDVHILSDKHVRPLRLLERLLWRPTRTASEVIARTKKIPKSALSMQAKARLTPMADIEERGMSLLIPLVIEDITVVGFFDPVDAGAPRNRDTRKTRWWLQDGDRRYARWRGSSLCVRQGHPGAVIRTSGARPSMLSCTTPSCCE